MIVKFQRKKIAHLMMCYSKAKTTQNKGQERQFMSDLDIRKKEARLTSQIYRLLSVQSYQLFHFHPK